MLSRINSGRPGLKKWVYKQHKTRKNREEKGGARKRRGANERATVELNSAKL